MILRPAQAKAVYAAMCELNDIGGRLYTEFKDTSGLAKIRVFDNSLGVFVQLINWEKSELYPSQAEFAKAYELEPAT